MQTWRSNETTRLVRIQSEFAQVPQLRRHSPLVTVFGSASVRPGDPTYESARAIGYYLAAENRHVLTGGGPGVMEAANRGAQEARGEMDDYGDWGDVSIGCTLSGLPGEQDPNEYMDQVYRFDHFYARKTAMVRYSEAFVVMPGGFGTMDELFEVLTLMQTGKMLRRPLLMVGMDFWSPLLTMIHERLAMDRMIGRGDESLITVSDFGEESGSVAWLVDVSYGL